MRLFRRKRNVDPELIDAFGDALDMKAISDSMIGCIIQVSPSFEPPEGQEWVEPDGRILSIAEYPELFGLIEDKWGGNKYGGSFAIPNLIQEAALLNQAEGASFGIELRSLMRIK